MQTLSLHRRRGWSSYLQMDCGSILFSVMAMTVNQMRHSSGINECSMILPVTLLDSVHAVHAGLLLVPEENGVFQAPEYRQNHVLVM